MLPPYVVHRHPGDKRGADFRVDPELTRFYRKADEADT